MLDDSKSAIGYAVITWGNDFFVEEGIDEGRFAESVLT